MVVRPGARRRSRPVEYIDYTNKIIPRGNVFEPYLYKRESFSFERETRLMCLIGEENPGAWEGSDRLVGPVGRDLQLDVDTCITEIRIAPDNPPWFVEVVRQSLKSAGLSKPVVQSDLAVDPID